LNLKSVIYKYDVCGQRSMGLGLGSSSPVTGELSVLAGFPDREEGV